MLVKDGEKPLDRKLILPQKCTSVTLRDKHQSLLAFLLIGFSQMHESIAADIDHVIT